MATVDELIVEIKADLRGVTAGLNNVKEQLNQTDRRSTILASSLKRLGPIVAAVASAGTVKGIAQIGDSFEQLRISLGTLFGGESGADKALNRINTFAQTTPFQLEDVTKAFISLKAQGIEPNERVLAAFGDAASATLTPLDSFNSLVRILGRSTQGALNLEDLNIIADRGIPVFQILGERLNKTRDELTEFGKTSQGAAAIMAALNEGLEENFGGLMIAQMDTLGTKVSNLQIGFKQVADVLYQSGIDTFLKGVVDSLTTAVIKVRDFLSSLFGGRPIPVEITALIDEGLIDEAKEELLSLARETERNMEAIRNRRGRGEKVRENRLEENQVFLNKINEALRELEARGETTIEIDATVLSPEQIEALAVVKKLLGDTQTEAEALEEQFKALATVSEGEGFGELTTEDLTKVMDHLVKLREELEETSETFTTVMAPAIAEAVQGFTSDFVNALMNGQSALETFKNFAKDLVGQIVTTFLQMAVVNRILNAVFGRFDGFEDLPTMQLAGGGNLSRGQPYLVGERGPEIFMPNTGGRIMNNADTRSAMSGGDGVVVNQTINLSAGVVGTVRSEVQRMLPDIANVTKLSVLDATRRGGTYRKGLLGA